MTTRQLSADDDGTDVELRASDVIELRLPENPTTGYRWELEDEPALELLLDSFDLAPEPLIGSGGTRILRLRPIGPGASQLRLKHWQAWEGEESVTQRFSVVLRVTE